MKTTIFFVGTLFAISAAASAQLPNGDGGNHKDKPGHKIAESSGTAHPDRKGWRIDVEKDSEGREKEIRFVSPDGKVTRRMAPDSVIVAKSGKGLVHRVANKEFPEEGYVEYGREMMGAEGKVKWKKTWKNYPEYGVDPEAGWSGWFEGIADNGERSYVTYRSTDGLYNLVVLDETGKEVSKAAYSQMFSGIEISPDGKMVGAEVYLQDGDTSLKHLFFLDVDTERTKTVRAEGADWMGGFVLSSGGPLIPGKILLWTEENNNPKTYQRIYYEFSALPDTLSGMRKKEKSR